MSRKTYSLDEQLTDRTAEIYRLRPMLRAAHIIGRKEEEDREIREQLGKLKKEISELTYLIMSYHEPLDDMPF